MDIVASGGRRVRPRAAAWLAAALLGAVASPAFATTIGPNAGYSATDDVSYSFVDISSTGTQVLANTNRTSSGENIGFTFAFYGSNYTSVSVSSNGILTFGATNNAATNLDLTTTATSGNKPSIAVFWDDLDFRLATDSNADGVYVETIGTTVGQRMFVIQWNRAAHFPVSGVTFSGEITFEAILFEGSNEILLNYQDVSWSASGYDYGGSATIGIRDTGGQTNGRRLQWSYNSAVLSNNYSVLFFTPEPGTWALFGAGLPALAAALAARRRKKKRGACGDHAPRS